MDVRVGPCDGCDAKQIGVVIAEDNVGGSGVPAAQLVDDERRTEIAAAKQSVRCADGLESGGEFPDVIVDVAEDREAHRSQAGWRILSANFSRNLRTLGVTT